MVFVDIRFAEKDPEVVYNKLKSIRELANVDTNVQVLKDGVVRSSFIHGSIFSVKNICEKLDEGDKVTVYCNKIKKELENPRELIIKDFKLF